MQLLSIYLALLLFSASLATESEFSRQNGTLKNLIGSKTKFTNYFADADHKTKKMVKARYISKGTAETKSSGTSDLVFENGNYSHTLILATNP